MLTVFLIVVTSMMQYQGKYDYCKEIKFKGAYCSTPKHLKKIGGK